MICVLSTLSSDKTRRAGRLERTEPPGEADWIYITGEKRTEGDRGVGATAGPALPLIILDKCRKYCTLLAKYKITGMEYIL